MLGFRAKSVNVDVRLEQTPLSMSIFREIVADAPAAIRLAFRWNAYLPLDLVLEMPWLIGPGKKPPLVAFEWSTVKPGEINSGVATFTDLSQWPHQAIRVQISLVVETVSTITKKWEPIPDYRDNKPIEQNYWSALMIDDASSAYGFRPLKITDVIDYVAYALKTRTAQ